MSKADLSKTDLSRADVVNNLNTSSNTDLLAASNNDLSNQLETSNQASSVGKVHTNLSVKPISIQIEKTEEKQKNTESRPE